MQIIKISPVSFKIILSKEDLQRHGTENILNHTEYSKDFFSEIIRETNNLYGNPFAEGCIDASFFESKDGGGELFISKVIKKENSATYLFTEKSSENIILLCRRLHKFCPPDDSRLYHIHGLYYLSLFYERANALVKSVIAEYGRVSVAKETELWLLEEHALVVIDSCAVQQISYHFGHTRNSKSMPE